MELNVASLNLPKTTIFQLKDLGYNYLCDIDPIKIKEKSGLIVDLSSLQKAPETRTALELYNEELLNDCILSYNENLDTILQDVIVPNTVTELASESCSGNTQVCFQLCISVQLPQWCGGMGGEAIYIDTNSNFASHRIAELAKDFIKRYDSLKTAKELLQTNFDESSILRHIYYTKVQDMTELKSCIKCLGSFLAGKRVRLIVINSFSFVMRTVEAKERKTVASRIFRDLRVLARTHNFAVIITNDLTTRVNKGESYITPSFGDSFYHLVNSRVLLSKNMESFRARLEKNINNSQKDTIFYL